MAHINHIWFHGYKPEKPEMRVEISLKPSGSVALNVPIPADFYDCIMKIAQAAADLHEQEMRAQILADKP